MDQSLAGKTKHNSLAERNNQFLLVATTACMLEAGVPPCFWRYAITCVSHLLNIEANDDEVSAWCKLHGEEFKGRMIPFGAMVYFKPSGAREIEQKHKFDPMGIPGVFAGYELGPGQQWSRKYRVWALCDWTKQSLAYDVEKPIPKLKAPHVTERVELKEPLEFPCKGDSEKIEGLKVKDRLDRNPEYLPPPPHDDGDDDDDQDDDDQGGGDLPSSKALRDPGEPDHEKSVDEMAQEMEDFCRSRGPPGIEHGMCRWSPGTRAGLRLRSQCQNRQLLRERHHLQVRCPKRKLDPSQQNLKLLLIGLARDLLKATCYVSLPIRITGILCLQHPCG